ncbi:hypothetical protein X943_004047, partial [Babesia divergens]
MAQHTSLLVCPKNLRECIDWLLCIHGRGKISELALAVQNVLVGSHSVSDDLEALASGLANFIGYSGSAVTGRGIVRRDYVKFFEELSPSTCRCLSSGSHDPSCLHCEALRLVFPGLSCKELCECAQKFKAFVDSVQNALNSNGSLGSNGLSDKVENILGKLKSVPQINDISSMQKSFEAFTLAFNALQKACATKPPEAFSSPSGSTPKNIAEGLYGFLHSGVEGWSKAPGRALKEAEKIPGNSLKGPLKAFFSNLKAEYALVYSSAKWDSLCSKSGSQPCPSCSSCHSSGLSSTSCHGSCCPNCDVRKAAKIFLGFIPCLYYALKYLKDKCNNGGWRDHIINHKDHSLHRFLVGMGFDLAKLDDSKNGKHIFDSLSSLFTGSSKPLQSLYEKSKKYFTSSSSSLVPSSDSKPETVRDILLWLSGLPFIPQFPKLLQHCNGLCSDIKDSSNPVKFDNFETSLFNSCFLSPFVLAAIEDHKEAFEKFPPYKSEWQKFSYPEDPSDLLEKLCEY